MAITAVTFFCEDIRNEQAGVDTLIGIMSDNIVTEIPDEIPVGLSATLPKVCLYTRINFTSDTVPNLIGFRLVKPDGTELGRNEISLETIQTAMEGVGDLPFCGIKSHVKILNFPLSPGIFQAIVSTEYGEIISGALNVMVASVDGS